MLVERIKKWLDRRYQDKDSLFGSVYHLRNGPQVIVSINVPGEQVQPEISLEVNEKDLPLDSVSRSFTGKACEPMPFADLGPHLILHLLFWRIMTTLMITG